MSLFSSLLRVTVLLFITTQYIGPSFLHCLAQLSSFFIHYGNLAQLSSFFIHYGNLAQLSSFFIHYGNLAQLSSFLIHYGNFKQLGVSLRVIRFWMTSFSFIKLPSLASSIHH
jgi:hypothetical protein